MSKLIGSLFSLYSSNLTIDFLTYLTTISIHKGQIMNYLTAKFIHNFEKNNLLEILENNFLSEIAIIERLSQLNLQGEELFQLDTLVNKDTEIYCSLCLKIKNYDLSTQSLEDSQNIQTNINKQAQLLKNNLLHIYRFSFNDIQHEVTINSKVLQNKNSRIKEYLPKISNTDELASHNWDIKSYEQTININSEESLEKEGRKIFDENKNSSTWQNNFQSLSSQTLNKTISKTINSLKNPNEASKGMYLITAIGIISLLLLIFLI